MPSSRASSFIVLFALASLGCQPRPTTPEPVPARFVDARTGETLARREVLARAATARVIYLGERHDRGEDHAMQRELAEALSEEGSLAVGFEMFARPFQAPLSAFAAGTLDEAGLLAATEWQTRWGFDFALYRPLLALGRERGAQLVALNAPREVTRTVARGGLEALDEAARSELPELALDVPSHRARILAIFANHPRLDAAGRERFYTAQVIWDETMAAEVARTVTAPDAPTRMIVIAGAMHVGRDAIPDRAARRGAGEAFVVLPLAEAELSEARAAAPLADVYFVTAE